MMREEMGWWLRYRREYRDELMDGKVEGSGMLWGMIKGRGGRYWG